MIIKMGASDFHGNDGEFAVDVAILPRTLVDSDSDMNVPQPFDPKTAALLHTLDTLSRISIHTQDAKRLFSPRKTQKVSGMPD